MAAKLARLSWLPGGLTAAFVLIAGRLVGSISAAPLELPVYDSMVRASRTAPSRDIIIVSIDDASVARLGAYPWPLEVHASLLDRLRADGARAVAFGEPLGAASSGAEGDRLRAALALLESSNLGDSAQAKDLRKLLGAAQSDRAAEARFSEAAAQSNVVLAVEIHMGGNSGSVALQPKHLVGGGNPAVLSAASAAQVTRAPATMIASSVNAVGHLHRAPDADGVLRTDVAAVRIGDALLPSFATAVVAAAAGIKPQQLAFASSHLLHVGEHELALEPGLKTRPHYFAPQGSRTFAQYSYWQVLGGEIPREQLRDKIVIVGNALSSAATTATPAGARSSAALLTASTVSSLLQGADYTRGLLPQVLEWAAAIAIVAFAALVLPHASILLGGIATALVIGILALGEFGLIYSAHTWARFMLPCLALTVGYAMHCVGDFIRRANTRTASAREPAGNLRSLGQTFQKQGQLDLAFETYRRCPLDAQTMELLYFLGMDFERRRQMQKAEAVYDYIAGRDPNYRDLRARRARAKEEALARDSTGNEAPKRPSAIMPARRPTSEDLESTVPARTLGRYEIERELGKGAMGVVYLGRDPKINRVVAIKAIPLAEEFEEQDLAEARARFFREAEMAGRLNHPAIVTVYDAGEDQGLAYIAMEYLRGQHLSHYTDASRLLPPRTTMLLVARVADALHYAHRQNVVHRDIKPANIMYNPDSDELKITDFGIARLTDTSRTKTGIVLGTPSFMSPEQLEGRNLDGRSDQFALGVSLFQLLCGHLPFRAESMPRLMQKIATEPHASVRLVRPDLPECIDGILDRTLAKSADDRYATCAELALALRECAGGEEKKAAAQPKHEWLIP